LTITGIVDEEEINSNSKKVKRKSTARGSVENVITILKKYLGLDAKDYDIHLNFPGGTPVDGPSAGTAILVSIYSSITSKPVDNKVAMTGELSILGDVKAVGGVPAKIEAAVRAGAKRVLIPYENWQDKYRDALIQIIPVRRVEEVIENSLIDNIDCISITSTNDNMQVLTASPTGDSSHIQNACK
jgi:Lon-like ATP-dependent protease